MNRWMILILFVLTLATGYLAFAFTPTSTLWLIDALFLASVIIFLMAFVHLAGRSLKTDMNRSPSPRFNNPVHEHVHNHTRTRSKINNDNNTS